MSALKKRERKDGEKKSARKDTVAESKNVEESSPKYEKGDFQQGTSIKGKEAMATFHFQCWIVCKKLIRKKRDYKESERESEEKKEKTKAEEPSFIAVCPVTTGHRESFQKRLHMSLFLLYLLYFQTMYIYLIR